MGAQIVGIVDFFDALTTDRPYRKALTPHMALVEMNRQRDRHFNRKLLDAFERILNDLITELFLKPRSKDKLGKARPW
jgi:HD-GYP domain-containing protein (c-di-GMP phosphodiesterase class II)